MFSQSSSLRDFDNHATRVLGKFEVKNNYSISLPYFISNKGHHVFQTVDTYYRRSSSTNYVENVSVPLLCVSALDDPVCTSEAIPWDECR